MSVADPSTIADWLARHVEERPESVAISYPGVDLTFRELAEESARVAAALRDRGIEPGGRVGVFMPNSLEYIYLVVAAALTGAELVPINARFKRRDLLYVLQKSQVQVLFTTTTVADFVDFTGLVLNAVEGLGESTPRTDINVSSVPALRHVVVTGDSVPEPLTPWAEFVGGAAAPELAQVAGSVSGDDVAVILFTSGTAASPKGCRLTHAALVGAWSAYGRDVGLSPDTPLWAPCPMFHVGGIGPLTSAMVAGARFVSAPHFDPDEALAQIVSTRASHLFPAFPAFTLGVLRSPSYTPEALSFVKTVLNVAPPDTQAMIQDLLPEGALLLTDFGMTEAAGIVTFTPMTDSTELRLTTNGVPFPGLYVRIADADDRPVEPGVQGEIQFRGPTAMLGYLDEPLANAAVFSADGWIKTGDLGRMAETGHLNYVGRIKDILKVGGENVAPAEVESLLSIHPAVATAQVIGRPDDKYGEIPVAFVELLPGRSATEQELIEHCRGQIANFKIPREVRFVTEWPMSATKIQKFRLRDLL